MSVAAMNFICIVEKNLIDYKNNLLFSLLLFLTNFIIIISIGCSFSCF